MPNDHEGNQIRARAESLLRSRAIGSTSVIESGRVEDPVAVRAPDGRFHSWFVPITVGDQLASFIQLLPDGTFTRFSSFQRREGELKGCPAAADWLDPSRIRRRAETLRLPGEKSGDPFLTYDRAPDRLVWAVPLTDASGAVRLVYVVGKTVYVPSQGGPRYE